MALFEARNKNTREELSWTNILTKNSYTAYTNERLISVTIRSDFQGCQLEYCLLFICLFVAAFHQTGLDTRSKARRPIKVGIKGRGRSGTSRYSNPAGLCCSSAHLVQCEPDEASSFTNPNMGRGTYAGLWLELDSKVSWGPLGILPSA